MNNDERDLIDAGAACVGEVAGPGSTLDPGIVAVSATGRIGGNALTVRCNPADNLGIHRALAEATAGDLLVVDGRGLLVGYVGDIIAEAAMARGVAGAVIDGGVRDTETMRGLGFPVWARGPAIPGTGKAMGEVGVPVVCGGSWIATGDFVVADLDGVAVVRRREVVRVAEEARKRCAAEEEFRRRLRDGELTIDLLGLR